MVDTVEIGRVTLRDTLSLDLSVWMNHPDDWDFRPVLSYAGTTLTITCANHGTTLASVDLDDEQDEALQRDRMAELRVKVHVHGIRVTVDMAYDSRGLLGFGASAGKAG